MSRTKRIYEDWLAQLQVEEVQDEQDGGFDE